MDRLAPLFTGQTVISTDTLGREPDWSPRVARAADLVFTINELRYALHLSIVDRVVRAVEITPPPKSPGIILGVINVQGQIALFGFSDTEAFIHRLVSAALTQGQFGRLASWFTIGETYFWRESQVFETLQKHTANPKHH